MKTCKDCLHYKICKVFNRNIGYSPIEVHCDGFTDRSEWVHLAHGEWMKHYQSGVTVAEGYVSSCCNMWNSRNSDYCPYCGAKMDGEEAKTALERMKENEENII